MNPQTVSPDWVLVRLSPAGQSFAGEGGQVHVATSQMSYIFTGSTPQRVLRVAEWQRMLALEAVNGQNLFELSSEPAATAPAPSNPATEVPHAV